MPREGVSKKEAEITAELAEVEAKKVQKEAIRAAKYEISLRKDYLRLAKASMDFAISVEILQMREDLRTIGDM